MVFQKEFNFGKRQSEQGYDKWISARQVAALELAKKVNLPLGHPVEVWLVGRVRLRGKLRLEPGELSIKEDALRHLKLNVDGVSFAYREMESCVRLD